MSQELSRIIIPRTWRSECISLAVAFVLSVLSIFLSYVLPESIIRGELLPLGNYSLMLDLPLFWFMPAVTLGCSAYRIYNVRYSVHVRGVEAEIGILALHRRATRLWYEDIRIVQTNQTLIQRFLGIGNLEVGTAATGTTEVVFKGIAAPQEVQDMLQRERDKRQRTQHSENNQHNTSEGRTLANS